MNFESKLSESRSLPDIVNFSASSKGSSARTAPIALLFSRSSKGDTTPRSSDLPKREFQQFDDSDCDSIGAVGELEKEERLKKDKTINDKQLSPSPRPLSRAGQKMLTAQIQGLKLRVVGIQNSGVLPSWADVCALLQELESCRKKSVLLEEKRTLDDLLNIVHLFHDEYVRCAESEFTKYRGYSKTEGTLEELKELVFTLPYKKGLHTNDRSRRAAILDNPGSNEVTQLRKKHENFLTIGVVTEESLAAYRAGASIESLVFFDTNIRDKYLQADRDLQAIECRVFEEQIRYKISELLSKISDEAEGIDEQKIVLALQPFKLNSEKFPKFQAELCAILEGFTLDLLAIVEENTLEGFRAKNLAIEEKLKGNYIGDNRKIAEYLERTGRFSTPLHDSRPPSRASSHASMSPFMMGYGSLKNSPENYKMSPGRISPDRSSPNDQFEF